MYCKWIKKSTIWHSLRINNWNCWQTAVVKTLWDMMLLENNHLWDGKRNSCMACLVVHDQDLIRKFLLVQLLTLCVILNIVCTQDVKQTRNDKIPVGN